jgi:Uncharacterised nucleotidyltransferase
MTAKPNISTHARHLLNILSLQPEKKTDHTTNHEFKNINWAEVVEIAQKSQVFPFLNSLVVEKELMSSKEIKLYFEKSRASGQLMTLRMIFEFNRLNNILRDLKVDVINFKGICLSETAYNSLYSRHFSDIDILVRDQHYINIKQILKEHGYYVPQYLPLNSSQENDDFSFFFGEYTALYPKGNISIDVHRQILGPGHLTFPLPSDRFWERRIKISIGGQEVWTLCPSDNLLYLCMNGLKDDWQSLRTVCDISELIKNHPDFCWDKLFQEAIELKIARPFMLGILIARYLLSTPIPEDFLSSLEKNVRVTSVARKACTRLKMSLDGDTQSHFLEILWMKWVVLNEKGSRRRYLSGILSRIWRLSFSINYRDIENVKLPSSLRFLYYFIRIFRIFRNPFNALKLIFR